MTESYSWVAGQENMSTHSGTGALVMAEWYWSIAQALLPYLLQDTLTNNLLSSIT